MLAPRGGISQGRRAASKVPLPLTLQPRRMFVRPVRSMKPTKMSGASSMPVLRQHSFTKTLPTYSFKRHFAARANWFPKQRGSTSSAFGSMLTPALLGVFAANCGVFALYLYIKSQKIGAASFKIWNTRYRMTMAWLYKHFGLSAESISSGRWWTSVTCHFTHMSWLHFGVNMAALFALAAPSAAALGTAGFLQLYALSAVTAATFSLWLTHDYFSSRSLKFFSHTPTTGASGAIAGAFAYSCMTGGSFLLNFVPVPARGILGAAILFSAGASYFKFLPEVDHGAHIGGMIGGVGMFVLTRGLR